MSTDIATATGGALAIADGQTSFTDAQRAVLRHMGADNAPEADLQVFLHVCQRTGLDPFARQVYLIGRNSWDPETRQTVKKYTIQTGIDGFRLIGHREAARRGETIAIPAHEWMHASGEWRSAWTKTWGMPLAARATIVRNGHSFTAVALFEEYVQTKKDGTPTQMWATRPAGMLAKCAEALAWRMAFPQDLAGIYTSDEMGSADSGPTPAPAEAPRSGTAALRARMVPAPETPPLTNEPVDAEVIEETGEAITDGQRRAMFAAMKKSGQFTAAETTDEGRAVRLAYISNVVGRPIASSNDLTAAESARVIDALNADATTDDGWPADDEPTRGTPAYLIGTEGDR